MGIIPQPLAGRRHWRPMATTTSSWLSGFEMSTLIANSWARHVDAASRATAQQITLATPGHCRTCAGADDMLSRRPMASWRPSTPTSKLAVLASEWFWAASGLGARAGVAPPDRVVPRGATQATGQLTAADRAAQLLTAMIELDPGDRLSPRVWPPSAASSRRSARSGIRQPGTQPFLVLDQDARPGGPRAGQLEWIRRSDHRRGCRRTRRPIEEDLTRVASCMPRTAPSRISGAERRAQTRAQHLIIGKQAAWFCRIYAQPSRSGRPGPCRRSSRSGSSQGRFGPRPACWSWKPVRVRRARPGR